MTCGIYAIVSKCDGKRYIGKSIDIEKRWSAHLGLLRKEKRSKDCNRHLFNSFKKYGEQNFGFEYLEVFDVVDDKLIAERELFWMETLDATCRSKGFNLRKDSDTKCIVSDETRQIISEAVKGERNPNYGNKWSDTQKARASNIAKQAHAAGRYSSEETRRKHSEWASRFWKENPDKKIQMAVKVSEAKTVYKIAQYDKQGNLIRVWDRMQQLIDHNPDFFRIAIYNCCNGYKKSYRGFLWKKVI